MEKCIAKVIIGIRYRNSFKIMDHSGEIIDMIWEHPKFGKGFFEEIGVNDFSKTLVNNSTGSYFKISHSDIIFCYGINDDSNLDNVIKRFTEYVEEIVIKDVIKK